jgi:hypothetical protein
MTINLSEGKPYFSQRNNKLNPSITCNTTACISMLVSSEIPFTYDKTMQPEDYLTQIMDLPEMWDLFRKKFPTLEKQGFVPREVHECLAAGVNKLVGHEIDKFRYDVTIPELVWQIAKNRKSFVTSGLWTSYGHMTNMCGVKFTDDAPLLINDWKTVSDIPMKQFEGFIYDDSWGNYSKGYKDQNGNDMFISLEDFIKIVRIPGGTKKFAHMLTI